MPLTRCKGCAVVEPPPLFHVMSSCELEQSLQLIEPIGWVNDDKKQLLLEAWCHPRILLFCRWPQSNQNAMWWKDGIKDKSRHLRHPICLPCSLLWRHQSVSCASLFRSHCHLCLLSKHPSALWRTPGPVRSWHVTARKNFKELLLMYRDFNPTIATGSWVRMRALCRMLWKFWSTLCYMQSCPPILLSTILPS